VGVEVDEAVAAELGLGEAEARGGAAPRRAAANGHER
jgi:hypothetical protein